MGYGQTMDLMSVKKYEVREQKMMGIKQPIDLLLEKYM